jgi:hypothetical protein
LLIDRIVSSSSRSICDDCVCDLEGHAAQIDILLASYDSIYFPYQCWNHSLEWDTSPVASVNCDSSFRIRRL